MYIQGWRGEPHPRHLLQMQAVWRFGQIQTDNSFVHYIVGTFLQWTSFIDCHGGPYCL